MRIKKYLRKENRTKIVLVAIVLLAFVLRFYRVADTPPALNWDEVSHGYNAYSLLKTGGDEWGQAFPIANFRAYGDYPLPLNLYLTAPFVFFFGLSELSIRLPHVLLGTLTALSVFYLVRGLVKKDKLALLASLLVAIGPWYVFPSRFVVQSNLAVFFLVSAMALFVNRRRHKYFVPLSFLFLGFSAFSYHSTRIFAPLLLLVMLYLHKKELFKSKKRKTALVSFAIIAIFFAPLPFILGREEARARASEVFLIDEGVVGEIINKRLSADLPDSINRLIYNRPVYFLKGFASNYIGYLSPNYLFFSGGTQYQFSVPGKGLEYMVNLVPFYLGLLFLAKGALRGKKDYQLLLFWLLLAPIPASITKETSAVIRSTTMLPITTVAIVVGFDEIIKFFKSERRVFRLALFFYFLVLAFEAFSYFGKYFGEYRKEYSWSWQHGYKEVVEYVKQNYDSYDNIVVTKRYGEPHEFILFYWPWDPEAYQNDPNLTRFYQSNWYWIDSFDKFSFVNDWQINEKGSGNYKFNLESGGVVDCGSVDCLLVTSPNNSPSGWEKLETINFLSEEPAFEMYEN